MKSFTTYLFVFILIINISCRWRDNNYIIDNDSDSLLLMNQFDSNLIENNYFLYMEYLSDAKWLYNKMCADTVETNLDYINKLKLTYGELELKINYDSRIDSTKDEITLCFDWNYNSKALNFFILKRQDCSWGLSFKLTNSKIDDSISNSIRHHIKNEKFPVQIKKIGKDYFKIEKYVHDTYKIEPNMDLYTIHNIRILEINFNFNRNYLHTNIEKLNPWLRLEAMKRGYLPMDYFYVIQEQIPWLENVEK